MKYHKLGFTMLELVAVIVIISILATIAIPTYRKFIAKSRQSEANINLKQIMTLQDAYYMEHNAYTALANIGNSDCGSAVLKNALGFRPKDCAGLRYTYNVASNIGTANSTTTPPAKQIYPGCTEVDGWQLTLATGSIANTTKVIDACK